MIAENTTKNINFVRIVYVLKYMRDGGHITASEYDRAKTYYSKLTGADIIIAD